MKTRSVMCLFLIMILASHVALADERVTYYAVYTDGQKTGHAMESRRVDGNRVTTTAQIEYAMKRMGVELVIRFAETHVETTDGKPLEFKYVQDMAMMSRVSRGTITPAGKLKLITKAAGRTQRETLDWPRGALMSEGLRLVGLQKGLTEGTRFSARQFDVMSNQANAIAAIVGPKKKVDLLGRVVVLTEVKTVISTMMGNISTVSYLDGNHVTQKSTVSQAGLTIDMIACDKAIALSPNDPVEVMGKFMLTSPIPAGKLASAQAATYTLRTKTGKKFTLPATGSQQVRKHADGTVTVTVRPAAPKAGAAMPYRGRDAEALAALKPSTYVESDHPNVVKLARKAVGDVTDAAQAAKRIEAFVNKYGRNSFRTTGWASAEHNLVSIGHVLSLSLS